MGYFQGDRIRSERRIGTPGGEGMKDLGEKGRITIYSRELAFGKTDNCLRCGGSHKDLPIYDISKNPILGEFNSYTTCPTTGEPILIAFEKPKPDNPQGGGNE
jgi:hypothetical protein